MCQAGTYSTDSQHNKTLKYVAKKAISKEMKVNCRSKNHKQPTNEKTKEICNIRPYIGLN
jgi:hypothetical protein